MTASPTATCQADAPVFGQAVRLVVGLTAGNLAAASCGEPAPAGAAAFDVLCDAISASTHERDERGQGASECHCRREERAVDIEVDEREAIVDLPAEQPLCRPGQDLRAVQPAG